MSIAEAYNKIGLRKARLALSLVFVMLATGVIVTLFEVAKSLLVPDITLWQSHIITIVFACTITPIFALFVLSRLEEYDQKAKENEEIKRTEAALRESEEKYRNLIEQVNDWVWEVDAKCLYTYASPRARELLGYAPEDLIGRSSFDFMLPQEAERVRKLIEPIFEAREVFSLLENTLVRKDGCMVTVETSGTPVFDERGAFRGYRGIDRDVTERNRAEEALRESEDKYRALFQSSFDAVIIALPDGRIESANTEACRIFGKTEEEIIRGGRYGVADKTDPRWQAFIEERERTGRSKGELNYRRKDGTVFPGEASSAFFKDRRGRTKVAIIIRDITERKRAEDELQTTLQRFYNILSNMRGAILLVGDDGRSEYANDMFCKYFTLSERPDDLAGITSPKMIEKIKGAYSDPDMEVARIAEIVERWEPVIGEEVHMSDGRTCMRDFIPLEIDGKRYGRLWHHIDITGRKRDETDLGEAKARAEIYLDLMGHDINNMNQSAIGFLELALQTLEMDGKIGRGGKLFIEKPLQAVQSSSRLIANVRKLQRLTDEGVKTMPVDLYDLFEELKAHDFDTDRDATINVHEAPHYLVEASDLLRDVFFNLISNAVKHSEPDRPVTIDIGVERVDQNGRTYYRCYVEDNGPGVPDQLKPKLFQRFQRGKTQAHGKGLGLYLVRTLVEIYHGKVWVEDRIDGDRAQGARFVVMLPAIGD
jgi:PAS domain S-box-containing protein